MSADLLPDAGFLPVEELPLLESAPLAVPRVNLLPPEIGEQRRLRRLAAGLAVAVVACTGVVGGLYTYESGQRADAQAQVDALTQTQRGLQQQVTALSSARTTQTSLQATKQAMTQAMSGEILYSKYLDALRLHVPDGVRFSNVAFTPPGQAAGSTTSTPSASAPTSSTSASSGAGGVGSLMVSGMARNADLVATWMDQLSSIDGLTDVYLSTDTVDDSTHLHSFTVTATVTSAALSHRFEQGN